MNRPAQLSLACLLACVSLPSHAEDNRGYSYFMGLSKQTLSYQETASILPIKTHAAISSPLLVTGGLFPMTANVLLSLDAASTFAGQGTTETWSATSSTLQGAPLSNATLQTNQFKLQQTRTNLLVHYRLGGQWFGIAGPAFHSQTFKRYSFQAGPDNATNIIAGQVIDESSSEIQLQLGIAFESENLRYTASHTALRLYVAKPLWRSVENTLVPNATFAGTSGFDAVVEGRYSLAVRDKLHIGFWAQYLRSVRGSDKQCIADASRNGNVGVCGVNRSQAELPKSTLTSQAYGLELLWKI